ncbi:MAG: hypothetical protein KME26_11655 [Oscillatoria princeps RMCB-10]|nr:hypothetical protein [Oscillatoria princeps RMCB-10]
MPASNAGALLAGLAPASPAPPEPLLQHRLLGLSRLAKACPHACQAIPQGGAGGGAGCARPGGSR